MKKAKVLFDYAPQEDDELRLEVGDIIMEVEPADTGWCKGLLKGKRGMFPDNFVEILEEESAPAPPSSAKKPSKKSGKRRMRATFAYQADNVDELSLEIGDIIEVIKDVEEGWAEGSCNGKKGVFPTNFVEPLPESSESEESGDGGIDKSASFKEEAPPSDEGLSTSSSKKVKGVGFGNIFADGPIQLKQSISDGKKKNHAVTSPAAKPVRKEDPLKDIVTSPPAKSAKKSVEYCRVLFEYTRDNDDELTLHKGEVIVVVNKDGGDDGWWEGEKVDENGKRVRGVFPDNFVDPLSPEEARQHEKHLQAKSEPESSKDKVLRPVSFKKTAPLVPPPPSQGAKPAPTSNNAEGESEDAMDSAFTESATTDHTLSHMKRPAGPKNRRKPGANERREKAQSAGPMELNGEEISSEDEKPEADKVPPRRESAKRGVAVLPGVEAGGPGGTPSWLQNLKSRQSQKRPPAAPPKETPLQAEAKPNWLQNLKKRQSSEFPPQADARAGQKAEESPSKPAEKVAMQPPKPAEPVTRPVPSPQAAKPANGPLMPPRQPTASVKQPPQRPVAPTEKPLAAWQVERQQKTKKAKSTDNDQFALYLKSIKRKKDPAPEPPVSSAPPGEPAPSTPEWKMSLPRKSPTAAKPAEPVKKPDKPPFGAALAVTRMKPAPPRGKPAPPSVKPASSSAVEELKEEMKNLREQMMKMKEEMKKEISKLSKEVQDERMQRMQLQSEVTKLRQLLPS